MEIPVFNDGRFRLYTIAETTDIYPKEIPEPTDMYIWYQELSIGDRLKSDLKQQGIEVTTKLRIPQYKGISSKNVVEIDEKLHHVYNAYHFRDTDGVLKTDLTLEVYDYDKE